MLSRALEIVMGDPDDESSAFAWSTVELNLPGMREYDLGKPRVQKLRVDFLLAVLLLVYFDDGRIAGPTKVLCRKALRQVASRLQHLGNQEAARKRRGESQRAGAWAGDITFLDQGVPRKLMTQMKWDKTVAILDWIMEHISNGVGMPRRAFRSKTGFLLHMATTYNPIEPYLQGLFVSKSSWRADLDVAGYHVISGQSSEHLDYERG
jgi:hypothetical protein